MSSRATARYLPNSITNDQEVPSCRSGGQKKPVIKITGHPVKFKYEDFSPFTTTAFNFLSISKALMQPSMRSEVGLVSKVFLVRTGIYIGCNDFLLFLK